MSDLHNRRDFLKTSALAALGSAAALNSGEKQLHATPAEASTITMPQTFHKGLPIGKLGPLNVTRLFLGCNQVSGGSHSRDLRYVSRLMLEYQTDERVLNTWQLCEEQGINTLLSDPFEKPVRLMKRYRKERGGKIQWISEVHPPKGYYEIRLADLKENLKQVLDNEPDALYIQGGICDSFVHRGLVDELGEALELMKLTGQPSGLGAHSVETPKACMKAGIQPDFFMKTFHADDYWSATPRAQRIEFVVDARSRDNHDNILSSMEQKPERGQESAASQPCCAGAFPMSYTRRMLTDRLPEEASNRVITWSCLPSSLKRNVWVSFSEWGSLVSAMKAPPSHEALVEILLPSASLSLCFLPSG